MTLRDSMAFCIAYVRTRRTRAIKHRATLETVQRRWLRRHLDFVAGRSRFYRDCAGLPLDSWPIIDKSTWMARFDDINTVGASRQSMTDLALHAEGSRDFSATWRRHAVGLSTGTSGSRGLFVVSAVERARWAGTLLAHLQPPDLFASERIALVLRAGGPLYESVAGRRLAFRYFDQAQPWDELVRGLQAFNPTVVVAPAQVLLALSSTPRCLAPKRLISVAEVLDPLDRRRIELVFNTRVEQVYQATEGLLGVTCQEGTVHLMEPEVLVEREWLDSDHSRFVPVVTDLWRRAQPVVRYRLNDVLRVRQGGCACGRAALALDGIEGRLDDVLWLNGSRQPVAAFPDLVSRQIVIAFANVRDYEVVGQGVGRWTLRLDPLPQGEVRSALVAAIDGLAQRLGARSPELRIEPLASERPVSTQKRRRIRNEPRVTCAS